MTPSTAPHAFDSAAPAASVTPLALHAMLGDGAEIAVIDVREQGVYAEGHLLLAASLPLSLLELEAPVRLPCRDARIVLIDDVAARAERAARLLRQCGYRQVMLLAGGNRAWTQAGLRLFSGLYVPSKAFGECVEHFHDTPRISAQALLEMSHVKLPLRLLDSRPMSEVADFSLPGACGCPGAELLARASGTPADVTIVVNCAGRTRGIIGAQSLINAGLPNTVYALENGTMGWHLAGLPLDTGAKSLAPLPEDSAHDAARAMALNLMHQHGVAVIGEAELAAMRADCQRTTYLFDVRLPEAWRVAHRADALSAPGGQLIQSTDQYAPVRHARIVLVDDDLVQAPMTAHWLAQMGWQVAVLQPDLSKNIASAQGARQGLVLVEPEPTPVIGPSELARRLAAGSTRVLDCRDSRLYRDGHIAGALFVIRSELAAVLPNLADQGGLTFVSDDGLLARFAAADARALGCDAVVLDGGYAAWTEAGMDVSRNDAQYLSAPHDAWYSPYQLDHGKEQAMRDYIAWETGLLDHLAEEPGIHFRIA